MDQSLEEICQSSNDPEERRQGVAYQPPEDQDVENFLAEFSRYLQERRRGRQLPQHRPPPARNQFRK